MNDETGGEGEGGDEAASTISTITELENGIFNMVIALCQAHATKMAIPAAKAIVADHLETLVVGLRTPDPANPMTTKEQ